MRNRALKLFIFLLAVFGFYELQAQSLYVNENDGTQSTYFLNSIAKLSFDSGTLTISQKDNSSVDYPLSDLRNLSFEDTATVNIEAELFVSQGIRIYPNPVNDELKIDLSGSECTDGILSISNLEGKLLKTKQIAGPGITSVRMSFLPRGIYLCHFRSTVGEKSIKIIKQ